MQEYQQKGQTSKTEIDGFTARAEGPRDEVFLLTL
jgi:hypothetical protein